MKILVTGGAGYIGSITTRKLIEEGHNVVVFDNLSTGHKENVFCKLVVGDLLNPEDIKTGLKNEHFDAVIHFAGKALARESMQKPSDYLNNNINGGINLLEYMRINGISNIVFSSTCAIYGFSNKLPVSENEDKLPVSIYGESKLIFEKILSWYDQIYKIKNVCLRYFNAAGASLDYSIGEMHSNETHIIPLAIEKAIRGDPFSLFGSNYPTSDGTCVRDYIHVEDLAIAHIKAINYLRKNNESNCFNLGTGKGYSNLQILKAIEDISHLTIDIEYKEKRVGDPPIIYANNSKASDILKFRPQYSDLDTIIKTAWNWHKKSLSVY